MILLRFLRFTKDFLVFYKKFFLKKKTSFKCIHNFFAGLIISGNEISQILLSLILSYVGGQRNRPRWIAWGVVFSSLSCFILVLPHVIYGAGDEVLQLTKEYVSQTNNISEYMVSLSRN